MAENSAKTDAFLKQLERQRLSKPCNRIIDLRGKVAGECQAYEFGGKTHYLDDRGYLLAKQLLQRFNNKYTIGVYETVLSARKKLSEQEDVAEQVTDRPVLLRDENHVQLMRLDAEVERKEPRITFVTPVEIRVDDMVYHGSTIDITSSAIRVSLKRTSALLSGENINVNLSEVAEKSGIAEFGQVSYKILKLTHDELRTQLVLTRNRHDSDVITQWLDNWITSKESPEHIDLDSELFNLANEIYQRVYIETISKPLFWLSPENKVHTLHMSASAAKHLNAIRTESDHFDIAKLLFNEMPLTTSDAIIGVSNDGAVIAPQDDKEAVQRVMAWKTQHADGALLLLKQVVNAAGQHSIDELQEPLSTLKSYNADYSNSFEQNFLNSYRLISVKDISECSQNLEASYTPAEVNQVEPATDLPEPSDIKHVIKRKAPRYKIKTDINAHLDGKSYQIKTNDASETGLNITLPVVLNVKLEGRINIDFVRWQSMTKNVQLKGLQFRIKNIRHWNGETLLGIERQTRACAPSVNRFFGNVIELNKEKLGVDEHHIRTTAESAVFNQLLRQHVTSVPLFLTMDENNARILQAVAGSKYNGAAEKKSHWSAMQRTFRSLWDSAKRQVDMQANTLNFILYCYLNSQQEWQIRLESDFGNTAEKSLFINQALMSPEHYFYHGSLTPIKTEQITQQTDLYETLIELHSHSQHKVKQIRQTLHSMFAVGELTDISKVIESVFRP
jgi:hypothetical protein